MRWKIHPAHLDFKMDTAIISVRGSNHNAKEWRMKAATKNGNGRLTAIGGEMPTNGAAETILSTQPYTVRVTIRGTADLLFHRWNCEAVAEKAAAPKGSKAKKTDDIETYVYRDDHRRVCLPGEYVRQSMIQAAKSKQDPRSPRKSAAELYEASVICLTELAPLGEKWDYEHGCRAVIQRAAITRVRPAFKKGWKATHDFVVAAPEYVSADNFQEVLSKAGQFVGVGDNRPSYGRFVIEKFEVVEL